MTVSVIIPTFNRAGSVGRAIRSVLAQTVKSHEIIVIDDGSTDDTATVLEPFAADIVHIRQPNAGVSAARNAGIERATGTWLTFLDSDDLWKPGWLATVAAARSQAADAGVIVADLMFEGPAYEKSLFAIRGFSFSPNTTTRVERPLPYVINGVSLIAIACRTDWVLSAGGFDDGLAMFEDLDLLVRLAQAGPWLFTPKLAARAQRLDEPVGRALTAIAAKNQVRAQGNLVDIYSRLSLSPHLKAADARLVQTSLSAAQFGQAKAMRATGLGRAALGPLMRSAQRHPSAWKGWSRAALLLGLGNHHYDHLIAGKRGFHREDHEA